MGTELLFTLLTLYWLPAHWYQVQDRSTWASEVYRWSGRAFSWGHTAPTLAWGIAIPMIVLARAPRPNKTRRWAARLVACAAVVATAAIFVMSVITDVSLAKRSPPPVDPLLWTHVSLGHSLLCLTAWLVLALRLTRAERGTRLLMFAAFPPIAAILSWPNVVSLLYTLFSPPRWLGGPMFAVDPPPDWLKSITLWSGQWLNTTARPTFVLFCLALWAYVRALNRFLREQAGPTDTTLAAHVGQ